MVDQFPLTPALEELWQEMIAVRYHPKYLEALHALDPSVREKYARLLAIPRIWLADGRESQVRTAISAVQATLNEIGQNPTL